MKSKHKIKRGIKNDTNKLMWYLLPMESVYEIMKVLQSGAKKYPPYNWKNVKPFRKRYYSAIMRHLYARFFKNELYDKEDGLLHTAHVGANILFLIWGDIVDIKNKKVSDMISENDSNIWK